MISFPFQCPLPPPRLPRKGADGAVVCDEQGNVWRYSGIEGSWVFFGALRTPPEVTEETDGLVTPSIFNRIANLRAATNGGLDVPDVLKILPHINAYWYLWNSADKTIRFSPEGPNDLRLEVDRSRLYSFIVKMSCRGDKGPIGDKGDRGPTGGAGLPEPSFPAVAPAAVLSTATPAPVMTISPDGRSWTFSVWDVQSPLETDVSIRLFDRQPPVDSDDGVRAVITIPPSGDQNKIVTTIIDSSISLGQPKVQYDRSANHISGVLVIQNESWLDRRWYMRARQKGPVGPPGDDASCLLTVQQCIMPISGALRATCPIIQFRMGCNDNQIMSFCTNLFPNVCVQNVRIAAAVSDVAPGSVASSGRLLAVKPQLDLCKDLIEWRFGAPDLVQPQLELPNWTPPVGCQDSQRYINFPWVPLTDKPANADEWDYAGGVRPRMYPWLIIEDQQPPAQDCDPCPPPGGGTPTVGMAGFLARNVLMGAQAVKSTPAAAPRIPTGPFDLWYGVLAGNCYCRENGEAPAYAGDVNRGSFISKAICEEQASECKDELVGAVNRP